MLFVYTKNEKRESIFKFNLGIQNILEEENKPKN